MEEEQVALELIIEESTNTEVVNQDAHPISAPVDSMDTAPDTQDLSAQSYGGVPVSGTLPDESPQGVESVRETETVELSPEESVVPESAVVKGSILDALSSVGEPLEKGIKFDETITATEEGIVEEAPTVQPLVEENAAEDTNLVDTGPV